MKGRSSMSASQAPADTDVVGGVRVEGVVEVAVTVCVKHPTADRPVWLRGADDGWEVGGQPPNRTKAPGLMFRADHPLVQQHPEIFRPVVLRLEGLPE